MTSRERQSIHTALDRFLDRLEAPFADMKKRVTALEKAERTRRAAEINDRLEAEKEEKHQQQTERLARLLSPDTLMGKARPDYSGENVTVDNDLIGPTLGEAQET